MAYKYFTVSVAGGGTTLAFYTAPAKLTNTRAILGWKSGFSRSNAKLETCNNKNYLSPLFVQLINGVSSGCLVAKVLLHLINTQLRSLTVPTRET